MKLRALLLLVIAILFAIIPLLFSSFDGYDPQDFPVVINQPAVQPAGYAFSIWGPIYGLLIAQAAWGYAYHAQDPSWDAPRLPLIAALVLGSAWIPLAGHQPRLAAVVILAMMLCANGAVLRLGRDERWLQAVPTAVLAGWVTAASGVSTGIVMAGQGWLNARIAAIVVILAVLLLAVAMQSRLARLPEYGLAVVWALIGIMVANWGLNSSIVTLSAIGALIMTTAALLSLRKTARLPPPLQR